MALSTQDFTLAKQRFNHAVAANSGRGVKNLCAAFFLWLATLKNKPDLQVKEFAALTGSNTIIADAACRIWAILLNKTTTTAAFFKGSDSATTSSSTAPEISQKQASLTTDVHFFPNGFSMASGFTISSDTTADGNTGSSAGDGASGVVLLGAP